MLVRYYWWLSLGVFFFFFFFCGWKNYLHKNSRAHSAGLIIFTGLFFHKYKTRRGGEREGEKKASDMLNSEKNRGKKKKVRESFQNALQLYRRVKKGVGKGEKFFHYEICGTNPWNVSRIWSGKLGYLFESGNFLNFIEASSYGGIIRVVFFPTDFLGLCENVLMM